MSTQSPPRIWPRWVQILIIAALLLQQIAIPMQLLADTSPREQALTRGANENVDAYLERVALAQPELFQQAALVAVQDALNGGLPEQPGDQALEEQIALYLDQAAQGEDPFGGATSSSAIEGDTYRWNSSQVDPASGLGSAWEMTAQPGVDPQLFARYFEEMLAQETSAATLPEAAIQPSLAETWLIASPVLAPPPVAEKLTPKRAPPALRVIDYASPSERLDLLAPEESIPGIFLPAEESASAATSSPENAPQASLSSLPAEKLSLASPADQPVAARANSLAADLGITVTAPLTAVYDSAITYTIVVSNAGPAIAAETKVTHNLPANGVFAGSPSGCVSKERKIVECSAGSLAVNESRTLQVNVTMKGNGVVTSTVQATNAGTVDPGGADAEAAAVLTVSSANRTTQEVGKIVVAANSFQTVAGQAEASGAVEIGFKEEGKAPVFHIKLGPEDSLTWTTGAESLNGSGFLAQILEDYDLFQGDFTADGSADNPLIVAAEGVTHTLTELGGFSLVGKAVITQVAVISGTASVSATIDFSQPGIVTDTKKALVALIKPGGKVEGTFKDFSMVLAGMKVEVDKAVITDEAITVKNATLTLPEKLGETQGVLSDLVIKPKGITLGGAGVKVSIPNIYPVGKPVTTTVAGLARAPVYASATLTGTTPTTPTIAIVDNSATIGVFDGKIGLQLEGTLQLWLPGNHRNIPIEFSINEDGELEASVKQIDLTIAGHALAMKKVKLNNGGLKVDEASLTIQGQEKKNKDQRLASRLHKMAPDGESRAVAAETATKKFTVTVKKVVINGSGISIGGAGITNYLPDVKIGSAATFAKMEFSLVVNDPTGDASIELAIKGVLKINLKDNDQEVKFSAKRDKEGKFSGTLEELSLTVAKSSLVLAEVTFDDSGVKAKSATLTLPKSLNEAKATINGVQIDSNGLSFGDANAKIPVEFAIGKADAANRVSVKGDLTLALAKDRTYGFGIEGTVTVKIASQTAEATGSLRMDSNGATRGSVDGLKVTIAGMEVALKSASIEDGKVKAGEATLSIPKAWGGLSATVYQLEISEDNVSIGGGAFKLPEIKAGDMVLSLEGKLKKEGDGYVIAAGGKLKMPNMGGRGCSGLGVAVEIYADGNQAVVMRIEPMTAEQVDTFQLRKVSVSLECTIPLGASGFDLTAISGTLTLSNNVTKIEVKVTMESKLRVGSFNALSAEGDMGIEYVKSPYKFEIGLGASMKIFSMFEAARARATMRFTDGDVPFLFKAELNINAVIAKGEVKLAAWTKDNRFHLTGRIYGEVGVRRGALVDSCWTIRIPTFWKTYTKRICLRIPPRDLFIGATMEFGEFQKSGGSAWGFKAGVRVAGKNYGIYVDTDGRFRVGNVDQYRLVDTPTLLRARSIHERIASGQLARAALTAEELDLFTAYSFHTDGSITVDVTNLAQHGDIGVSIIRQPDDTDVVISLLRPDGLMISPANLPSNVTFEETLVSGEDMLDPETGEPTPANEVPPVVQTVMNVTDAQLGEWKLHLSRQPTYEFVVNVDGTLYGPPVEKLAVSGKEALDNQVTLNWTQTTELTSTVTIYAMQGPLTTTASYTDTRQVVTAAGITATEVVTTDLGEVTQFSGAPVAQFTYLPGKQTPSESVNLAALRSDVYTLWLEVDDSRNPPTRKHFPGTATVWHDWVDNWTANLQVTPTLGGLQVEWDKHSNPDVDGYEIELTAIGDSADPDTFALDLGENISETVTGLSALQAYSVTVAGYDTGTGRLSSSESVRATPLHAPFTFAANPPGLTLNGGSGGAVNLQLTSTAELYPDWVFLDIAALPEGFDYALPTDIVTPTVAGVQASLTITPSDDLPGGVYTVTVEAASSGDVKQVKLPVTVNEPSFALRATPAAAVRVSDNTLNLRQGGSAQVTIDAAYQNGEQDFVEVDIIEAPAGLDWSFSADGFGPGQSVTLILTGTESLLPDSYAVVLVGTDYVQEKLLSLTLNVGGFDLIAFQPAADPQAEPLWGFDRWNTLPGSQVQFYALLDGANWPDPVNLSLDPAFQSDDLLVELSQTTASVSEWVTATVTVLPGAREGRHEIPVIATSQGVTRTLLLYVTIGGDPYHTDLQVLLADGPQNDEVVAGEPFTLTTTFYNGGYKEYTGDDRIFHLLWVPTPYLSDILSRAEQPTSGCPGPFNDPGHRVLACGPHYPVAPGERSDESTFLFEVTPQTAEGALLDLILQASNNLYSRWKSDPADTQSLQLRVVRSSDLSLQATATSALAGESMTYTATVTQNGPSDADDVQVEFFLPDGVGLVSASPNCSQAAELITCAAGSVAAGSQATVTATVTVQPDQRDLLETLIVASSASEDPNFNNNYVFIDSPVDAQATLAVWIAPRTTSATEGDSVHYTIVVTNQGPSQATDVDVAVVIPDILDITDFLVNDVPSQADQLDLNPGESITLTVTALTLEDSNGAALLVDAEADAWEAPLVKESDQSLTIANANPTAVFSSTMAVNEGEWGILSVLVDDPGVLDSLDVAWDLDNDGQFDNGSDARVLFDARAIDGPATRPVAVRVRDDDGGEVTINGTVAIVNIAPVVESQPRKRGPYNEPVVINFDFVDTSSADTHTAQVDWGDGTVENVPVAARSAQSQASHTYNKVGDYKAKVCVADGNGGQGCTQVEVQAACQENGLQVRFGDIGATTVISLSNSSGSTAIPSGMPFTLYRQGAVVQTIALPAELAVSASTTLNFSLTDYQPITQTLRLAVDDNGSGVKTTSLCTGAVEQVASGVQQPTTMRYYFPIIHNSTAQREKETASERKIHLPAVNR